MKRFPFAFTLVLIGALIAGVPPSGAKSAVPNRESDSEKQFLMTHRKADPRFLTSVERVGPCKISSDPVSHVHVPSELYPQESVDQGETGTVQLELTFDNDWCVRKAMIVKSTGYWRLDQASLSFLMTVRYKPEPEAMKIKDGNSTMVVKLEWRRGVCGGYKKCLYIDLSPSA